MQDASSETLKGAHLDTIIQNEPINLRLSGRYVFSDGAITNISSQGSYWQNKASSNNYAYNITFYTTLLDTRLSYYSKGTGFQFRCLVR